MLKTTLIASLMCFALVTPSFAQDPGQCDEARLTKLRTDIDAMTDKEKQKSFMEDWEKANTAFKAKDIPGCDKNAKHAEEGIKNGQNG